MKEANKAQKDSKAEKEHSSVQWEGQSRKLEMGKEI